MSSSTRRGPGRFVLAALSAMAAAASLGLLAQRWMTYELLGVEGGVADRAIAAAVLAGIGVATALVVGVPSHAITRLLGLGGTPRAVVFCLLGSVVTTIAHRALASWATSAVDEAVVPALGLVFFGVFYALYYRGAGSSGSPR